METYCLKVLKELSNLLADGNRVKVTCRNGNFPGVYTGIIYSVDTLSGNIELNTGTDESKPVIKKINCEDVTGIELASTGGENGFISIQPIQTRLKTAAATASAH